MSKSTKTSTRTSNGLLLKGFRKQNGYSQADIAEVVGKNKRTVSSYEIGRFNMPSSVISILNKKYKLGLIDSSKTTKTTKSSKKSVKKSTFTSRFTDFYKSTGLSVVSFCEKYGLSTASTYRILNGVGQHYFSVSQIANISKDTDFMKLILG